MWKTWSVDQIHAHVSALDNEQRLDFVKAHRAELLQGVQQQSIKACCATLVTYASLDNENIQDPLTLPAWNTCFNANHDEECINAMMLWEIGHDRLHLVSFMTAQWPNLVRILHAIRDGARSHKWLQCAWILVSLWVVRLTPAVVMQHWNSNLVELISDCVRNSDTNRHPMLEVVALALYKFIGFVYIYIRECAQRPCTRKRKRDILHNESVVRSTDTRLLVFHLCRMMRSLCVTLYDSNPMLLTTLAYASGSLQVRVNSPVSVHSLYSQLRSDMNRVTTPLVVITCALNFIDGMCDGEHMELIKSRLPLEYRMLVALSLPMICDEFVNLHRWIDLMKPCVSATVCVQMCFKIVTDDYPCMARIATQMNPLNIMVCGESRRSLDLFPINMTADKRHSKLLDVCKTYADLLVDSDCFKNVSASWCLRVEVAKFLGYKRLTLAAPQHALTFGSTITLARECLVCCRDDVALVLIAPCGHQMCCVCVPQVNEKCHVCRAVVKGVVDSIFNNE